MGDSLTPEVIAGLWLPADPQVSSDCTRVAWVAAPAGWSGEHPVSSLWVGDVAAGAARRWTRGHEDSWPRWSPDGTRLAFRSDRAERGTHGLYLLDPEGGEAWPLVERKRSVVAYSWSPDGERLAFLAPDEPPDDDERREKARADAEVYGEWRELARLWVIDTSGGEPRRVWAPDLHLAEVAWSPDGSRMALLVAAGPLEEHRSATTVWTVGPDGAAPRRLCGVPYGTSVGWSGAETVVFAGSHGDEPQCGATVWAVPASGGKRVVVGTAVEELRCTIGVAHAPDGACTLGLVAEGLDTRVELLDVPGGGAREVVADVTGEVGGMAVAASDGGLVVALIVHGEHAVARVLVGPPGELRVASDHGADLAGVPLARAEALNATASDQTHLDAVVLRPVGAGDGPWPTAVLVHGGPYGRSGLCSHTSPLDWGQLLAQHGYAVVMPNYRGGLGRGNEFATRARGDMGGAGWGDVMAVVDAAVDAGIADRDRLGIGGWSQGGFLTAWAVTATDRFRLGVMGAGVSDWNLMAATSDMPDFEAVLGGSRPWDGPGPHHAAQGSPISFAARRTTPLLILHGADDRRVPHSQAVAFHRAMRGQEAPVQLGTYPREPHTIREYAHQVDLQRRVLEWFDRHVR